VPMSSPTTRSLYSLAMAFSVLCSYRAAGSADGAFASAPTVTPFNFTA